MMKKRNTEGFALAYVVIVIFILCTLSIALMSMTLRTLQAQENSVQQMKDKYAAQGEIERFVAELDAELNSEYSGSDCSNYKNAYDTAKDVISGIISSSDFPFYPSNDRFSLDSFDDNKHEYDGKYSYDVVSSAGTASVHAVVYISFTIELDDQTPERTQDDILYDRYPSPDFHYDISFSSPSFSLYEIASSTDSEEGGDT